MPLSPPSVLVTLMLLFQAGTQSANPWTTKVAEAVGRAERNPTRLRLEKALDVTWRADDWVAGMKLAELAENQDKRSPRLDSSMARAYWRAGRIATAERIAARIDRATDDAIALRTLITIDLARCNFDAALALAERLAESRKPTAEDLYAVIAARMGANRLEGAADLVRRAEKLIDPENGYPENYVAEAIAGVADFLEAIGPGPVNQIAAFGEAPMPALVLLNLPVCEVFINGRGPYRMIVDTGGSIMIAVDTAVAQEIGLKVLAQATVRGVSGTAESGEALIDELRIGSIRCERVVARTLDVRSSIMNAADGIIGTGIFADGRMTLDWANARLVVARSSDEPAPGVPTEVRLIGDAKLIAPVTLEGEVAAALIDSGADAVAVAPSRLRALFPDRDVQTFDPGVGIGIGSGEMPKISLSRGVDLEFAGRRLQNYSGLGLDVLDTTLGPIIGVQSDILLGMPTFREMRSFTVDFRRCKMWVEWLRSE